MATYTQIKNVANQRSKFPFHGWPLETLFNIYANLSKSLFDSGIAIPCKDLAGNVLCLNLIDNSEKQLHNLWIKMLV